MAITYPLSLPSTPAVAFITITDAAAVAVTQSPYTYEEQVFVHDGDLYSAEIALAAMKRDTGAADWIAFLQSLNGREGTFLMGHPTETAPRGTWAGSPKADGAHAVGAKTLTLKDLSAGATAKAGDWVQWGSGSNSRLYQVLQDATANGSGAMTIEINHRLRIALANNDVPVTTAAKGLWRLAANERAWSQGIGQAVQGISIRAVEVI